MNNKWSKVEKITDYIHAPVVACSALTSVGIANGRTIPVIPKLTLWYPSIYLNMDI